MIHKILNHRYSSESRQSSGGLIGDHFLISLLDKLLTRNSNNEWCRRWFDFQLASVKPVFEIVQESVKVCTTGMSYLHTFIKQQY